MFLPRWIRTILEVFVGVFQSLDDKNERERAILLLQKIGDDGKISVGEWGKLGGLLKILKPPDRRKR
jgi:hypothetical protein